MQKTVTRPEPDQMRPRITLKQCQYVLAAAKTGSITSAAERVQISQPSVSAAISALEAEFGVPLFRRNPPHGILLTPTGARLMPELRTILGRIGGLYALARTGAVNGTRVTE